MTRLPIFIAKNDTGHSNPEVLYRQKRHQTYLNGYSLDPTGLHNGSRKRMSGRILIEETRYAGSDKSLTRLQLQASNEDKAGGTRRNFLHLYPVYRLP